jgi:hypothetical protein
MERTNRNFIGIVDEELLDWSKLCVIGHTNEDDSNEERPALADASGNGRQSYVGYELLIRSIPMIDVDDEEIMQGFLVLEHKNEYLALLEGEFFNYYMTSPIKSWYRDLTSSWQESGWIRKEKALTYYRSISTVDLIFAKFATAGGSGLKLFSKSVLTVLVLGCLVIRVFTMDIWNILLKRKVEGDQRNLFKDISVTVADIWEN